VKITKGALQVFPALALLYVGQKAWIAEWIDTLPVLKTQGFLLRLKQTLFHPWRIPASQSGLTALAASSPPGGRDQLRPGCSAVRATTEGSPAETDAYLLGVAIDKKGKLAPIHRAVVALLPEKGPKRDRLVVT
jgi:hypothetical protein